MLDRSVTAIFGNFLIQVEYFVCYCFQPHYFFYAGSIASVHKLQHILSAFERSALTLTDLKGYLMYNRKPRRVSHRLASVMFGGGGGGGGLMNNE